MSSAPLRIACVTEKPDPKWVWIRDRVAWRRPLEWVFYRPALRGPVDRAVKRPIVGRLGEGLRLRRDAARAPYDLVVTHMPYCSAWMADLLGREKGAARHLAFAFNFTDLPKGLSLFRMTNAFRRVDRFAVSTTLEKNLYAEYFRVDPDRFDLMRWGINPPIDAPSPPRVDRPYIAALGGEARDYATLIEAARLSPETRFVVICRPWSLDGVNVPPNVRVFVNIPWQEAWSLVAHAAFAVLPLRDERAPNGVVTVVGAMHLGMAQIVTRSEGLSDYVEDGVTAVLTPPGDPTALKAAIDRLLAEPARAAAIGAAAREFARARCSEASTVDYFRGFLDRTFG